MVDPYTEYYLRQAEGRDYGGSYTSSSQKGDGLGSFLGGLFRRVFPLFKSGAKALGKEALSTGVNMLRDAITGKSMKDSMRTRITEAGGNLTTKAARKMESMVGSGYKRRNGQRTDQSQASIKRRRITAPQRRKNIASEKTVRKTRSPRDIFS